MLFVGSHSLYIASRFSVSDRLTVRRGTSDDYSAIQEFLGDITEAEAVLEALKSEKSLSPSRKEKEIHFFLAEVQNQLIGVALLDHCPEYRTFTDQFDVEEFITINLHDLKHKPILLKSLILNPLYEPQTRWFMEEAMRLSGLSVVLYPVDHKNPRSLLTERMVKREFVPVKRRRMIQFPGNTRDGEDVLASLPVNLLLLTNSILYEPKISVNTRVVVLGGSAVGLAFLESLVYVRWILLLVLAIKKFM